MSKERFSTENLQVGDKVILVRSSWGVHTEEVGEIVKKTPTGLVDISLGNGRPHIRFRATGSLYEAQDRYSRNNSWLEFYTEEKGKKIQEAKEKRALVNWFTKLEWNKLTLEDLKSTYDHVRNLYSS